MNNWEPDYKISLQETDRHLSSMKRQLGSKLKRNIYSPPKGFHTGIMLDHTQEFTRPSRDAVDFRKQDDLQRNYEQKIISLTKRLEEQSRTISHLKETIALQSDDIQTMKREIADLHNRSSSSYNNKSNSVITERKFEMFQRQVQSELENLTSQIYRAGSTSSYKTGFETSSLRYQQDVARDLKSQKRLIEEETDAVRREIDLIKSRIEKIESESSIHVRDVKDIDRRCDSIQRSVTSLTDEQRKTMKNTEKKNNDLLFMKKELQDISNVVGEFQNCNRFTKPSAEVQPKNTKLSATKKSKPRQTKSNIGDNLFKHHRQNTDSDGDLSLNFDDEIVTTSFEVDHGNEAVDDSLHLTTTVLTLTPAADDDDFLESFEHDDGFSLKMDELKLDSREEPTDHGNLVEHDDGSLFGDYGETGFTEDKANQHLENDLFSDNIKSDSLKGLIDDEEFPNFIPDENMENSKTGNGLFIDDLDENDIFDEDLIDDIPKSGNNDSLFIDTEKSGNISDFEFEMDSKSIDDSKIQSTFYDDLGLTDQSSGLSGLEGFSDSEETTFK